MSVLLSSRGLLVVVIVFAIVNAAGAAFSCYKQNPIHGSTSEVECSTGTCYSFESNVHGVKVVMKDCSPEPIGRCCIKKTMSAVTGQMCFCTTSLCNSATMDSSATPVCNSAIAPSVALPLLVLPAVLQYFFN